MHLSPIKRRAPTATDYYSFDLTDDPNLILGLSNLNLMGASDVENHDLRSEVEAYFLDMHGVSDSILFWQVSYNFINSYY